MKIIITNSNLATHQPNEKTLTRESKISKILFPVVIPEMQNQLVNCIDDSAGQKKTFYLIELNREYSPLCEKIIYDAVDKIPKDKLSSIYFQYQACLKAETKAESIKFIKRFREKCFTEIKEKGIRQIFMQFVTSLTSLPQNDSGLVNAAEEFRKALQSKTI